jgi:hypothetical protein
MSEVSVEELESAIGMDDEERCSKGRGPQQPAEEKKKEGKVEVKNERGVEPCRPPRPEGNR